MRKIILLVIIASLLNFLATHACMANSEKQVADYLRELDLWWVYEFPVFVYDEKKRPRVWTPDFQIPKLVMHVEVCGKRGL